MSLKASRWHRLGPLAVVALLLVGCGSSDAATGGGGSGVATSDDGEPIDDPSPTPGDADDADVAPRDPATPFSPGSVYEADAEPILTSFFPFEPGTYRTGALGTPMSFTATERLNTQPNYGGQFVLSDISSRAPDDRGLVFIRVGSFSDPAAPNTPIEEQTPWPSDDFLGWLENLHDGVVATDPVDTTVNGLAAIRVDLELSDDIECGWLPGFCVGLAGSLQDIKAMNHGASYRVWIVEQGDEDPLLISADIARDEDESWFERADAVMDTIHAFGEVAPNPVQELAPGTNQLHTLGGVEVDLPDNLAELTNGRSRLINPWTGRGFAFIPVTDQPGAIYFSDRPHDREGNPLASTDDVVAELTDAGAELTEVETTSIGGVNARVFNVMATDVGAIMLRFSPLDVNEQFLGWDAPSAGRIWLIEHPDRGLMMISTHAFEDIDKMLPLVTELGDAIVESMTFTS